MAHWNDPAASRNPRIGGRSVRSAKDETELAPGASWRADHAELARLGKEAAKEVQALALDEGKHFGALRRAIRKHLASSQTGKAIEQLVGELLA